MRLLTIPFVLLPLLGCGEARFSSLPADMDHLNTPDAGAAGEAGSPPSTPSNGGEGGEPSTVVHHHGSSKPEGSGGAPATVVNTTDDAGEAVAAGAYTAGEGGVPSSGGSTAGSGGSTAGSDAVAGIGGSGAAAPVCPPGADTGMACTGEGRCPGANISCWCADNSITCTWSPMGDGGSPGDVGQGGAGTGGSGGACVISRGSPGVLPAVPGVYEYDVPAAAAWIFVPSTCGYWTSDPCSGSPPLTTVYDYTWIEGPANADTNNAHYSTIYVNVSNVGLIYCTNQNADVTGTCQAAQ